MKKIKITLFIALFGLLLVSCNRDITEPTMSSAPAKSGISDLTYTGQFTVNYADSVMKFSWSAADFGFASSTTYSLQMSSKSDFSSNVATMFDTQKLTGTVKVSDINTLLLSWNYPIGSPATIYYRIATTLTGTSVAPIFSDAKSKSLTPYDAVINYPMVYVPGAYQGWSPGADNGRLYSYGFNSTYEGIVRIKDGTNASSEFKITNIPAWPPAAGAIAWGGSLTKTGNNYSGTLDPNGGNLNVSAGVYAITVDVNSKAITLTKTDDWGIIGSSVPPYDWSKDVDMFYNGQRKMWEIKADFKAGLFKFRANDAWDLNYGSIANDGTLQAGKDNIPIAADGNYLIRFDPVKLTYTVK